MSLIRTLSAMLRDKKLCPKPVKCPYTGCGGQMKFTREESRVVARCAGKPGRRCGFEISMDSAVSLGKKSKYTLRFTENTRCPMCGNILRLLEGTPGTPTFHICFGWRCGYVAEIGVGTIRVTPDRINRKPIYLTEYFTEYFAEEK